MFSQLCVYFFLSIGGGAPNVALGQAILQTRHAQVAKSQQSCAHFLAFNAPNTQFACGVAIRNCKNSRFCFFGIDLFYTFS